MLLKLIICFYFRYEIGHILGDGNFAVVRHCMNKKTQEEYALKIIDKAKCKGKEHMIDSEVSILRQVSYIYKDFAGFYVFCKLYLVFFVYLFHSTHWNISSNIKSL